MCDLPGNQDARRFPGLCQIRVHWGPPSEAGEGCCYVKFGAVRPRAGAAAHFGALLDSCGSLAAAVRMPNLLAEVNLAREEAYLQMVARGFRAETLW
jgi:hypothetical protein